MEEGALCQSASLKYMSMARSCRVPLQYLNNAAHWDDLLLAVGPGVLIPRPETQSLLQFAAEVVFNPL